MLYTAQYRYSGHDRLDITVKGNCPAGRLYAPTWEMVKAIKDGRINEDEYTMVYYDLLVSRWKQSEEARTEMMVLVNMTKGTETMPPRPVTVVCFCPASSFCHRYLLTNFLSHNWQVPYGGER